MKNKLITPKFIISIVIFFLICFVGCVFDIQAKQVQQSQLLTAGYSPDDSFRIKLVAVENETENMEFQVFYGFDAPTAFVFPKTTFKYQAEKEIGLAARNILAIKSVKGSYLPVFIQDGGLASGQVEDGYEGPFVISMWLQQPNMSEVNKTHIRYSVKKDNIGTIGVRIGQKGDYRLVAYDNIKFME
ncbi:hypothetical protein KBB68_02445 [Candidatus Babeliales bacterium]|nr:hypothetical protein [Candidatus Babeliales bacterium]